jgi:RNA methyltransferase, TrmH family
MPSTFPSNVPLRASTRQLSDWRKLTTKKGRREAGQLLIEGVRLVTEAIESDFHVSAVILSDDERGHGAWRKLFPTAAKKKVAAFHLSSTDFDKLTDTVHSAGIGCVIDWTPAKFDVMKQSGKIRHALVCDRISDPGNLGTLIRTAAGLGLDAIFLLPDTAELTNPKTVRAAAGALFHVPVYEDVAAETIMSWAKRESIAVIVADAHKGQPSVLLTSGRWALIVGGETIPLDQTWESAASHWISLPLQRGVESLNAAIAGAIIMDRLCHTPVAEKPKGRQHRS